MDAITNFEEVILNKVRSTVSSVEDEWFQISLPEPQRRERKLAFFNGICDFCDSILSNERAAKERILRRIEDTKLEIFQLCQEMNLTFEEPSSMSIFDTDKFLQSKFMKLHEEKERRINELKELAAQEEVICKFLGETPTPVREKFTPALEDITLMKNRIEELKKEKKQRIETYEALRKDIVGFVEQLEQPLEDKLLLDIMCNSSPESSLTHSTLMDIRKLHADLEFEAKELEVQYLELREKILFLWNLLQLSSEAKETFLASVSSHSPSSIAKLEEHLAELNTLKLQSMERLTNDLKNNLDKWWNKCYVGEDIKKQFTQHISGKLPEEVFEAYEEEVKKWERYYEEHSFIFMKVDQFLDLFDAMQQLEDRLKDPSRLFNTRGGTLLQEEKERKKVKMEFPILQEKLINLCSDYETKCGKPFLIDGCSIQEYLCKLWEYHSLRKEKEKNTRQNKKNTPATKAVPNLKRTTAGVGGSRKREREVDENQEKNAKRPARHLTPRKPPAMFSSPVKKIHGFMEGAKSVPGSKKVLSQRNHHLPPLRQPHFREEDACNGSMSYDNFKAALKRLNTKDIVHSSILSSESKVLSPVQQFTQNFPEEEDNKRRTFLKQTLNLASPMKKKTPCGSYVGSPIQGGAAGGAFLARASSQPSITKSMSPSKLSIRKKLLWLM